MRKRTWKRLEAQFARFPGSRAEGATNAKISQVELALDRSFDEDYREFLRRYGSAIVGSGPIYGVNPCSFLGESSWSVLEMTKRFRQEGWPGVEDWYIISGDGRGNPIGIDRKGRVWMSDHDVGDIPLIARSFEKYILMLLSDLDDEE